MKVLVAFFLIKRNLHGYSNGIGTDRPLNNFSALKSFLAKTAT